MTGMGLQLDVLLFVWLPSNVKHAPRSLGLLAVGCECDTADLGPKPHPLPLALTQLLSVYASLPGPMALQATELDEACAVAAGQLPRALEVFYGLRQHVDPTENLVREDDAMQRALSSVFTLLQQVGYNGNTPVNDYLSTPLGFGLPLFFSCSFGAR